MLSLVVLVSGGGSNLRALLEAIESGATESDTIEGEAIHQAGFPARVVAVGADRDAEGLSHAADFGIPTFTVPFSDFPDRASWGDELLQQVRQWQPDLVILSGFMRLLPEGVIAALGPRVINTHPAYLPEFPGAHAVRDCLMAGASETGASIIVVDAGVDSGPVVAQQRVPILAGDTEDSLHERIKAVERTLLVQTVHGIADGTINLEEFA